jgi:hypothetical protein
MEQPGINSEAADKVLQKDLENVIRKVASGKTLSSAERARVEAMASGSKDSTVYAKNIVHLAEILGVTRRTLTTWRKIEGAPQALPNGQHEVNLWREFIRSNGLKGAKETGHNTESLKARRLLVDIEDRELRLAIRKATVVPMELVREQWISKVGRARSLLESRFLNELPPILCGLDTHMIREKLNQALLEVYEILHSK